ncbi:TonB-dependent receptor domain-containing protein [Alistipes sp. ZOR0009]|uniref:TonB-dependent receptor domain-containing protein n=1 Tax=Alistipes sp. ZOR0009 TaxID=1339253 RepID=UPI0009DEAD2E|nr:TonB-dependent receptor [Alistipes sp. ZOR0009]
MKHLLLLLAITFSMPCLSQNRFIIVGTTADTSSKKAAEFVAIALLSLKDSSILSSTISDISGHFELRNVPQGKYILKTSHMGYNPYTKQIFVHGAKGTINIGILKLKGKEINLEEIVVKGKNKPIRIAKDTLEFNPSAFKPRENDVVEDVLKKLPGVQVDKDGSISINGKAVTQIMVDGKRFFINDPKLASQNLPANIVDKIQLVDKKSDQAEFTKINDGETEKIINLTLKKDKKHGYFGNARAGVGTNDTYDLGAKIGGFKGSTQVFGTGGYNNINRGGRNGSVAFPNPNRQGITTSGNAGLTLNSEIDNQLSVNGSYNYGYSNLSQQTSSHRENIEISDTYNSDLFSYSDNSTNKHAIQTRIEYKLDSTASLVFSPNLQVSEGVSKDNKQAHQFKADGDLLNSEKSKTNTTSNTKEYGVDMLLRKMLRKQRQTISANITYNQEDNTSDKYTKQENFYTATNTNETRDQNIILKGENDSFSTKLSYTHPLGKYFTAEINNKLAYKYNSNLNNAFDYNANTAKYDIKNGLYSKNTKNKRLTDITGLRVNFTKSNLSINAGANISYSKIDYLNQRGNNWIDTSANYQNISPLVNITYLKEQSTFINFSYRGTTSQPSINQIHPIQNPETPNSIIIGNSNLKQEEQHSFLLGYNYFSNTSFLSLNNFTTLNISHNSIQNKSYRDDKLGKTYYQAVNVNGLYSIDNQTTIGKSLFDNKLQLSAYTNFNYSHTPGFINNIKIFNNQSVIGESLRGYLMLNFMELGFDVGYNFNNAEYRRLTNNNSIVKTNNQYSTVALNGNITAFLPLGIEVKSTYDIDKKYGNSTEDSNKSSLWNASVTKKLLKDQSLSITLLAFDILNEYKPFKRTVTSSYIDETTFNTVSQTFLVSISYNLNKFGGQKNRKPDSIKPSIGN